ncbi:TRAP transporter substrate-binding protein [Salinispira pacifica]
MKRFIALSLVLLFASAMAFAEGKQETVTIRIGHIRDTSSPTHMAALKFKDLVEQGSNGRIQVKVFPNSQLGDPKAMFAQMQTGDLEMVYGGINTFAWINGGEAYEITAMPFIYKDYACMRGALLSDFFKPVMEKAEKETGITIVNINGDTAPRGLTADRPINNADDFKGLKIRTAASPTVLTAMKTLGALPQQIPFSDLYMALKTGVVNAQENGAIVVADQHLYEVQKYYMKTDYIRDIETFYAATPFWNGLSKADRDLIYKATEQAGDYETKLTQEKLATVYDTLKQHMTVITPDMASIRAKLKGAFDSFEGSKWPSGLLAKIADYEESCTQ